MKKLIPIVLVFSNVLMAMDPPPAESGGSSGGNSGGSGDETPDFVPPDSSADLVRDFPSTGPGRPGRRVSYYLDHEWEEDDERNRPVKMIMDSELGSFSAAPDLGHGMFETTEPGIFTNEPQYDATGEPTYLNFVLIEGMLVWIGGHVPILGNFTISRSSHPEVNDITFHFAPDPSHQYTLDLETLIMHVTATTDGEHLYAEPAPLDLVSNLFPDPGLSFACFSSPV